MVTVKQACDIAMAAFAKGPDKDVDVHINCVNEFDDVFVVVIRPDIDYGWSPFVVDIVDKKTGRHEHTNMPDALIKENYKQYTKEEIERL